MGERALAAIVEKERTGEAIESLRAEGVYDASRRVREHDETANELPVTEAPVETAVEDVIGQADPDSRVAGLDDLLRDRGWTDEEIGHAPNAWAVVGDVVLVRFPADCPRPAEVGEALLDLQGAGTVLAREGIGGPTRKPDVSVVAGSGDTETVHTEHGTKYALDLAAVMFSPGNKRERVRMGEVVSADDRVFDMFAGIGYFALPMARAGASVSAAEINPDAFRYLTENALLNGVEDRVTPYLADCRDVVDWHGDSGIDVDVAADRVVMGHYDAHECLDAALAILEPGGVLHLHEATPDALLWDRPISRLADAAEAAGRSASVLDRRRVKTHAEGVSHVVVDARVE